MATPSRRRIDIQRLTPAETAIRNAMLAVEDVGADPLLTDAVNLLQQARDKVADYVDHDPGTAVVTQEINVGIHYRARGIANVIQGVTNCSDETVSALIKALTEFGEEIKRQAV